MSTATREPAHGLEHAVDPFGTTMPLLHAQWAWLTNPAALAQQGLETVFAAQRLALHGTLRAMGLPHEDPVPPRRTMTASATRCGRATRPGTA